MKNKKLNSLAYVLGASLFVSGLSVSAYQGLNPKEEEILETVLTEENVNKNEIKNLEIEIDQENGKEIMEIDFEVDSREVEVKVDVESNKVIKKEIETKQSTTETTTMITKDKALEIALAHANVSKNNISNLEVKLDKDDGTTKYEVEFDVGTIEYDYDIDAVSGKILKVEKEERKQTTSSTSVITKEKALEIALTYAGANKSDVKDLEIELEKGIYEISFEIGNVEYELDIEASSGKVLQMKKEIDD